MTLDLAELERLSAAATPGPWYHTSDGATIALAIDAGDDRFSVGHAPDIAHLDDHEYIENPRATADSALICAARNQLPVLLARIRELEELAEDYRLDFLDKCKASAAAMGKLRARIEELEDGEALSEMVKRAEGYAEDWRKLLLQQAEQRIEELEAENKCIQAVAANLETDNMNLIMENRWIPVEERLPDVPFEPAYYIVRSADADAEYIYPAVYDGGWTYPCGGGMVFPITHWRELPRGPKG